MIISGVVTGDFQNNDPDGSRDLGGFFIQDDTPDNDPGSSEGIFIYDGNNPATDVDVGDRVTVQGTVSEYFGENADYGASGDRHWRRIHTGYRRNAARRTHRDE